MLGGCAAFGGGCGRAAVNAPSNHLLPLATAGMLANHVLRRVPAGIIEHLRFEVRLAYKALSWQDRLCTRRFSQDSLVITAWIWLLQLCLPKVQGLRAEVGGGGNY